MTFKNYQETEKGVYDHTDSYKHKESIVANFIYSTQTYHTKNLSRKSHAPNMYS